MTNDQVLILSVLVAALSMFLWGRWRHDIVAAGALLLCVFFGLVPAGEAFQGFSHPAVITVACVLILSSGLQNSGAIDVLVQKILPSSSGTTLNILALSALAALLSGFINNVGALALLMPVGIQISNKHNIPPGNVLMPLAFSSILGGTTTLIGTPPNLIVSGFRAEVGMNNFAMFDFMPVGIAITAIGTVFVGLFGWRLVPARKQADTTSFDTGTYLSEALIVEGSSAVDMRLNDVEQQLYEVDAQVVGLVRHNLHLSAPNPGRILHAGDILIIESEPEGLASALSSLGLKLLEDVPTKPEDEGTEKNVGERQDKKDKAKDSVSSTISEDEAKSTSGEIVIQELVSMPNGILNGRSASDIQLRNRYGINLLAISRQGMRSIKRLRSTPILAGDVLLLQGAPEAIFGFASEFSLLPLAKRDIRVPKKGQALIATLIMGAAVISSALGLLDAMVSFATGVVLFIALRIVPPRSAYAAVDWSVIVLLGSMLPVASAMDSTGTADLIARFLIDNLAKGDAVIGLAAMLVATMFLTDFMNNAATAAVMCPISISTASQLGVNPDTFLMAIAIGASCAFLTPIGHQNNTLILGPGGFRFGDYWRMGLPTEILVVSASIPMLLWVWPL